MKLEILSFGEALKYEPKENSAGIRIFGSHKDNIIYWMQDLKESDNWMSINRYEFDDVWPKDWKEYAEYDTKCEEFQKYLKKEQEEYPKMTEESLLGYFEARGHPYGRCVLFDEKRAKKILENFEKIKDRVENTVIHDLEGKHRASPIGKAMNNIYGWGIKGLEEKFPSSRKFVYDIMMKASGKR